MAAKMTLAAVGLASAAGIAASTEQAPPGLRRMGELTGPCERAAPNPWPATAAERSMYLSRLEGLRAACIGHAGFLSVLGGLLLEDGDPEEALVWLERSLLLDPGNLGAQADHALALAALGEPEALKQLASAWATRVDIPPALRARLFPQASPSASNLRLGRSGLPVWAFQREVSVMAGYENNLDQSPRLSELTLTAPGGNVVLPVTSQPRRGAGVLASSVLQAAFSPKPGSIWRTGLTAAARTTPSERRTDWRYLQWTAAAVHQWPWWRSHVELGTAWFAGPLSEPYRLLRAGVAADAAVWTCRLRLGTDLEQREQSATTTFDARTTGLQLGAQCPSVALQGWVWSLVVRAAEDHPDDERRPGGVQRQHTLGARLTGSVGPRWQVDVGLRVSLLRDALGYSALLENDARRRLTQQQMTVELAYRHEASLLGGAQTVLQLHLAQQDSNLPLFQYRAASLYGGLRWNW